MTPNPEDIQHIDYEINAKLRLEINHLMEKMGEQLAGIKERKQEVQQAKIDRKYKETDPGIIKIDKEIKVVQKKTIRL